MKQGENGFAGTEDDFRFLDAPLHADVVRLTEYWHQQRGTRAMPNRSDIVPGDIVGLLPNLVIYDVIDDGHDYRVRIFGTALVSLVG